MSEYQYVEFRAVDRPLTDAELEFAAKQSTRAEISGWSFQNEYHFGDFRGDVNGMLRGGYDVYLHYANFGVRTAAFRLPAGLPFHKRLWSQYVGVGELTWDKDRNGSAGILSLNPFHDAGGIDEIWSPGDYMEDLVEVRNRLVAGDLRALYALWLCAALDDQSVDPNVIEPLVPIGIGECVDSFAGFMEFFGLDPLILVAAAEGTPDGAERPSNDELCRRWVEQLNHSKVKELLHRFLVMEPNTVKAEMMAEIQQADSGPDWPTIAKGRSFEILLDRTEQLRADHDEKERQAHEVAAKREAAKKERERQERMKEMLQEPQAWLRTASKLVEQRGTENYEAAACILSDLREASVAMRARRSRGLMRLI